MRISFLFTLLLFGSILLYAQDYTQEVSKSSPYGQPHPDAPDAIKDWEELIGTCICKSVTRIDATTWGDTLSMTWKWQYILNGWGVQDHALKSDGTHGGSIRQFIPDSAKWYVHYYSNVGPTPVLPAWSGTRNGDRIVLYNRQKAPNGMDGFYRITFSDIKPTGFNWEGDWISIDQSIVYPTWRIYCKKEG